MKNLIWLLLLVGCSRQSVDSNSTSKLLVIGDSISIGYAPYLVGSTHNPGNANNSTYGLAHLDAWLGTTNWEVITFNFGIHDMCPQLFCTSEATDPTSSDAVVSETDYEANLHLIAQRLKQTNAKIYFVSTSYMDATIASVWYVRQPIYRNIALQVMAEENIEVIDILALTQNNPQYYLPNDIHFTPEGYMAIATQIDETLKN